jgi:hypothetical protein
VELAELCYRQKKFLLAARFLDSAFKVDPQLLTESTSDHVVLAARSAVLAAAGLGDSAGKLSPNECLKWREKALTWLKVELEAWKKLTKDSTAKIRLGSKTSPELWEEHPDLVSVRQGESLKNLPSGEQKSWSAFWAQVDLFCSKKGKQAKQP